MSDRLKRAHSEAEDRMAALMQEMHEHGELRHLQGKPLALDEDDPAWLVTRMMKQEGFSHPLLERRREVQQQLEAADARIERLLERRYWLVQERATTPPDAARAFNDGRRFKLQDYAAHLKELNRSIRDYNLTVPLTLQITPVQVDPQMKRVEGLAPALDPDEFGHARSSGSWWRNLRRAKPR